MPVVSYGKCGGATCLCARLVYLPVVPAWKDAGQCRARESRQEPPPYFFEKMISSNVQRPPGRGGLQTERLRTNNGACP